MSAALYKTVELYVLAELPSIQLGYCLSFDDTQLEIERIRAEAFTSLATLDPGGVAQHWGHAADDADRYRQRLARARLAGEPPTRP